MALSQSDMLDGINMMAIYRKDYDIIKDLLDKGDDKLFIRIMEEVLSGNLLWSDFDKILSHTRYPEILEENLEYQELIKKEIRLLTEFRNKFVKPNEDDAVTALDLNVGFVANSYGLDETNDEFFKREYLRIQDNLLYEITKPRDTDNALTLQIKSELKRNLKNGKLLILDINNNLTDTNGYIYRENAEGAFVRGSDGNFRAYTSDDSSLKRYSRSFKYDDKMIYTIEDGKPVELAPYINPADIFLFINSYVIPLDYRYQRLDEMDRLFMKNNNMSEEMMLQFKALSLWLRRMEG